jgi:hypothetical protein
MCLNNEKKIFYSMTETQELRELFSQTITRELFYSVQNNLNVFPFLFEEAKKI